MLIKFQSVFFFYLIENGIILNVDFWAWSFIKLCEEIWELFCIDILLKIKLLSKKKDSQAQD